MIGFKKTVALLIVMMIIYLVMGDSTGREAFADEIATRTDAEKTSYDKYIGDGFNVEFTIDNKWDNGFNATIKITNTTDVKIDNWRLIMPLKNTFPNIWNAEVEETYEDLYVIKNAGWNQDIPAYGSISFGITSYEAFSGFPSYYALIGKTVEVDETEYTIEYSVVDAWEKGLIGQISITNYKSEAIEDWNVKFRYEGKIIEVWDAVLLSDNNDFVEFSCENYNQNILPKETVSFRFKVELEEELASPTDYILTEVINGEYEIYLMANYIEDDGNIEIWYIGSDEYDEYKIFESVNGVDFELVNTLSEIKTEVINDYSEKLYLYIVGEKNGKEVKSEIVYIESDKDEVNIINPDKDNDGLCDYLEYINDCDMENVDTDDDTLSDYYEFKYTYTDPTMNDTDGDMIVDSDEDLDGDGLSNGAEYQKGTNPAMYDSDRDKLSDHEEVYEYGTDPLLYDTDGDGLSDYEDVKLGFDPLVKDTDNNGIIDSDEYVPQHSEVEIVDSDKPLFNRVSVDISCKGLLENYIYFENMNKLDDSASNVVGLLSAPMEISVDTSFKDATITFGYDEELLGDTQEEDLAILWYDSKNDEYVLVDSKVNIENDTISYKTDHFSMYLVVDKKIWLDCWREESEYKDSSVQNYYDVVFVVDTSGSMRGDRIVLAKKALKSFIETMAVGDRFGIVSFSDKARSDIYLSDPNSIDSETLDSTLDGLVASGGTNANAGVTKALDMFENDLFSTSSNEKIMILICDGDINVTNATLNRAITDKIPINCLNVASGSAKDMRRIANATGGMYYYAATTDDIAEKMSQLQENTIDNIDMTDTDGDGLYDVFETNGMKISNGQIIYTDATKRDTDGDGISDFDEMGGLSSNKQLYIDGDLYSCTLFHNKSNPNSVDTDGDGIPDSVDKEKNKVNNVTIAELENPNYFQIDTNDSGYFGGGNQTWWNGRNKLISASGCGLIASCDSEIYLSLKDSRFNGNSNLAVNNDKVDYDSYVSYVELRELTRYPIENLPGSCLDQVHPWVISGGINKFYDSNGIDMTTSWAASYYSGVTNSTIIDNINNNIPVVMSYSNILSKTDCEYVNDKGKKVKNCLAYYEPSSAGVGGIKQRISGHYFTAIGVYKVYNSSTKKYVTYYSIVSWGKNYYIKADDFLNNLSYFTNILSTY